MALMRAYAARLRHARLRHARLRKQTRDIIRFIGLIIDDKGARYDDS
jgi:hypothetical protein